MGRSSSFMKGLKKGTWASEEDQKLVTYMEKHRHGSWREVPVKAGLQRCRKSCRLRWTNYLRPDIKKGKFSSHEEQTIIQLHALLGNRWSAIATHLPKRTDNEIKNYWNVHLKKRLTKMGIDPITHKPRTINSNVSHMTQWEITRLEAEARLVHGSRFVPDFYQLNHRGPAHLVSKSLMSSLSLPLPLEVLKAWQNVTLVENVDPQTLKDMTMEDHTNSWKISNGLLNTHESPNDEGTQNILEVSNMTYRDSYSMKASTNQSVNNGSNENYHDDFEHDTNYWSSILDNLQNDLSKS